MIQKAKTGNHGALNLTYRISPEQLENGHRYPRIVPRNTAPRVIRPHGFHFLSIQVAMYLGIILLGRPSVAWLVEKYANSYSHDVVLLVDQTSSALIRFLGYNGVECLHCNLYVIFLPPPRIRVVLICSKPDDGTATRRFSHVGMQVRGAYDAFGGELCSP